ncbi:menaquinone biosynthesis protein [Paenibacillus radicis (ex Xue et al. 2023)]|uniref:Chorismate dehydratase n=1 Tax=Paenibacillus radicis (ex Xue et al. 2023) TaxID=2972489 RepID=A0ABT1YMS0_9BACL|nr:menaquinone biosynthesis protein [Paenibacillus radicis (ex Xue et al. 2023)]MCR8634464.1 menaquinone biosynthesis protein [Paenibacillus radicis (ex Xue et al. 2023)]
MSSTSKPVRIGRIDFTNVWPLFYNFPLESFQGEVEFITQVPTQLNEAMAKGEIDIGPISSFSYGEHTDDYVLLPNMSVSAHKCVQSILLFHRKPLEELSGASIALPTTSATSVNLLKIILRRFYEVEPDYHYAAPVLKDMLKTADAALLIGDHAIRESWIDSGLMVTDLAEEWNRLTGHWMSFAVCAIRKQLAEERPELVSRIYSAFMESKRKSLSDLSSMIRDAQELLGGTASYWERYFSSLIYEFGPEQQAGLKLYYRYAWELGFLKQEAPIQLWNDKTVTQVTE